MNTLKRLFACLCIIYGIDVKADETNVCVATPLTPITIPNVPQIISMSTRAVRMFPPLISLNKEEIQQTTLRGVSIRSELAMVEPVTATYQKPTNSTPSEEIVALARLLSRTSKNEGETFPLSKRLSFGLSRTEPETGGIRAFFNWKFKR